MLTRQTRHFCAYRPFAVSSSGKRAAPIDYYAATLRTAAIAAYAAARHAEIHALSAAHAGELLAKKRRDGRCLPTSRHKCSSAKNTGATRRRCEEDADYFDATDCELRCVAPLDVSFAHSNASTSGRPATRKRRRLHATFATGHTNDTGHRFPHSVTRRRTAGFIITR